MSSFVVFYLFYIIMSFTALWALLAVVLTGLGATIGEAWIGVKSLDVFSKNPNLWGNLRSLTILGIALVESAAIYGLVVALLILFTTDITWVQAVAAGGTIGGVWVFTCLYEAKVVVQALDSILRNPEIEGEIRSNMILYVALVESAAIYALVTALLILFS